MIRCVNCNIAILRKDEIKDMKCRNCSKNWSKAFNCEGGKKYMFYCKLSEFEILMWWYHSEKKKGNIKKANKILRVTLK